MDYEVEGIRPRGRPQRKPGQRLWEKTVRPNNYYYCYYIHLMAFL